MRVYKNDIKNIQMKKLIKIITVICVTLVMFGCEKESIFEGTPDIELVKVYTLSNITGSGLNKINVYQTKPLLIEYETATKVAKYTSKGFVDSSTDTNYEVVLNKVVDILDDAGVKTGETIIGYTISADKTTGDGTLTVLTDVSTVYNIKVTETEVYN
jgi:hypothetical protein